jgi:hypothetical protein
MWELIGMPDLINQDPPLMQRQIRDLVQGLFEMTGTEAIFSRGRFIWLCLDGKSDFFISKGAVV